MNLSDCYVQVTTVCVLFQKSQRTLRKIEVQRLKEPEVLDDFKKVVFTTGQLHVKIHSDCDSMHKVTKVQLDKTCNGGG